ncbi:hypothetical protein ACLQ24_24385, partial [Micromonospora sp. DT4]|uniref:hypothetical protein n=1 Tax=Micromonospora sp. DT4 TaxID=3393438 RepID=UPI003CEAC472
SAKPPDASTPNDFSLRSRPVTRQSLTAHYVDFRWIGKLERGEHRWPSDERRAALRSVLGTANDSGLGLYSPRRTGDGQFPALDGWTERSATAALAPVGRTFTGGYVGLEQALVVAAGECSDHANDAGAWKVPNGEIDQLRNDVRSVALSFNALTPAEAVKETLRIRAVAVRYLPRTRRPSQQSDLYLTLGQTVSLLASASIDLGLWDTARQYAQAAEKYGDIIGHAGARAYALGLQATIAYWTGRAAEAVQYASMAVEQAPIGVARTRALYILARAWSHHGSADEVGRALRAAEDVRNVEGTDELHDLIGGEFGYSVPQQARSASTAWLQVGHIDAATTAARRAVDVVAASTSDPWSTVEAEARVDLATCQLLAGDVEAARETLTSLWSMPLSWRRVGLLGRVQRVHDMLTAAQWRPVLVAREVAEEAALFTATSSPTTEPTPS